MHLLHKQARLVSVQRASHSALALMLLGTARTCTDLLLETAANMHPAGSNQPQKAQVLVRHQPSDLQSAALHKQLWMTLHIQQTHAVMATSQQRLIHLPSSSDLIKLIASRRTHFLLAMCILVPRPVAVCQSQKTMIIRIVNFTDCSFGYVRHALRLFDLRTIVVLTMYVYQHKIVELAACHCQKLVN